MHPSKVPQSVQDAIDTISAQCDKRDVVEALGVLEGWIYKED
jgi:hypothetical protein